MTPRARRDEPDIILRGVEAPIIGVIPGLHGREQVRRVIDQLLGRRSR